MDKVFDKNFVKPSDPGFVYDKVVDFSKNNKEDNSWDKSGDDDEDYSEDWD